MYCLEEPGYKTRLQAACPLSISATMLLIHALGALFSLIFVSSVEAIARRNLSGKRDGTQEASWVEVRSSRTSVLKFALTYVLVAY